MGKKFELRIDHNGLKYLFEQPTLNARKTIWLEFLSECDVNIKHIIGKEKKLLMYSTKGYISCMLQPLVCIIQI